MLNPSAPPRPVDPSAAENRDGERRTLTPGSKRTRSRISDANSSAICSSLLTVTVAGTSLTFCGTRVAVTVIVAPASASLSATCARPIPVVIANASASAAQAGRAARLTSEPERVRQVSRAINCKSGRGNAISIINLIMRVILNIKLIMLGSPQRQPGIVLVPPGRLCASPGLQQCNPGAF